MEPERSAGGSEGEGFYPAVSPGLVRGETAAFSQHEPAAEFTPVPLAHQDTFLRAGHYTVVTSDGAVVHHVGKTEDGETSFCVQAVPAPFAAGADLEKEAVSHAADAEQQPQYLVSDLATYQLSAAGDVYKLVVREDKGPLQEEPHPDEPELHPYSQVQLAADGLADAGVDEPTADSVVARTPTPPPAPLPPPLPPQHCLVCDLSLFNYRALGIFGHTTHQTSTTYAIKLRQVTGHHNNFVYHSEVICESCASLLNVVDSFESRLREIKARLDNTRAEVTMKFVQTSSRYDTVSLNRAISAEGESGTISVEKPDVEIHTRGPGKGKKRQAVAEDVAFEPPLKKKARTKTAPEKDVSYEKTKILDSSNEEPGGRRRPVRRAAAERVPAVENDSEEEDAPPGPDALPQTEAAAECASPLPVKSDVDEDADDPGEEADGDGDDDDDDEEEGDAEDEQPLQGVDDTDAPPVRVANMCAECGRIFINPMVQRVHILSHQWPTPPPLPPQPTAEDFVTIIDMDHYGAGADDVLAQAVQQMNRAESPPAAPAPPALPPPPPLQPKPAEDTGGTASGEGARGLRKVQDVYKCDTCPNVFKTVQGLQRHHRKEHVQVVWRCYVCWQALSSLRRLKRHVASHGEKNVCAVCLEPFESKVALKAHVTRKHPETQTKNNFCELCQKHFDNQGFLEHARGVHGVGGDAARPYTCGQCGKTMVSSSCYLRHLKVHKKDYKCQYCGKSFNGRTGLDNHERTHTGEKPYCCPDCERTFTSKQVLNIHVRTFHRQNPYACKRCNRRCESKASFIRHMRSHAGVAPYECPVCCKKMTTEYSLKMHIRAVHDRKMPFKCEICHKAFPYKSSLTLHANTHSGGKTHVCDVCGKCFASRGSLRTHMHTHSAEKPYKCEWCDRSFSRKDLLAGHKLQIHGIQPEMNYSRLSKH